MKKFILLGMSVVLGGGFLMAGDDPSIKDPLRSQIQESMGAFIEENTFDKSMPLYDAVAGDLLRLRLKKLHAGIVKKGDFYVSCADFVDQKGREVDVDFLVAEKGGGVRTVQALVHKVEKKKRPYHLED